MKEKSPPVSYINNCLSPFFKSCHKIDWQNPHRVSKLYGEFFCHSLPSTFISVKNHLANLYIEIIRYAILTIANIIGHINTPIAISNESCLIGSFLYIINTIIDPINTYSIIPIMSNNILIIVPPLFLYVYTLSML